MKKKFSVLWKSSKQPRKQKKYVYNAPYHIKKKLIGVHLTKELRTKYNKRAVTLKKGDKVKIMRGGYKGKIGKVERIDIKKSRIFITGIEVVKKDGSKMLFPLNPSNLLITELNLDDKKRQQSLDRKKKQKGGK